MGATHFNTSAKLNQGIEEMFLHLSQQMIIKEDDKAKNTPGYSSPFSSRGTVTVIDDTQNPTQRQKSGCCGGGNSSVVEGQIDPNSPP